MSWTECQDRAIGIDHFDDPSCMANVTDLDFEFQNTTKGNQYHAQIQRYVKQFSRELNMVIQDHNCQHVRKQPRLDLMEVMCSPDSELTKQVQRLGGRAERFGRYKVISKPVRVVDVCSTEWSWAIPNIYGTVQFASHGVNGATST